MLQPLLATIMLRCADPSAFIVPYRTFQALEADPELLQWWFLRHKPAGRPLYTALRGRDRLDAGTAMEKSNSRSAPTIMSS